MRYRPDTDGTLHFVLDTIRNEPCFGTIYSKATSAAQEADKLNRLYDNWRSATAAFKLAA